MSLSLDLAIGNIFIITAPNGDALELVVHRRSGGSKKLIFNIPDRYDVQLIKPKWQGEVHGRRFPVVKRV